MNTTKLRALALPALALVALSSAAQAVTITENFNSYTASETPVTGLAASPGFGTTTGGWLTGWRSASSTTAATARILDSSPFTGGGNYMSGTLTANSTTGALDRIALNKAYDVAGNSLASATAIYTNFDLRVDSMPATMNLEILDNGARGTGNINASWILRISNGFWSVFDGSTVTSTGFAATAGTTYSVSIVSNPVTFKWDYTISNGSTSVSGTSLDFRTSSFVTDNTAGSEGGRWFLVTASETTDIAGQSTTFSIDNIVISTTAPIPEPSTFALLGGVVALGAAATRRRR